MLSIKMSKEVVARQVQGEGKIARPEAQLRLARLLELEYMLSYVPDGGDVMVDEELFQFLRF